MEDEPWRLLLWDDEDNRRLMETYAPWFLPTYDAYPGEIYRADAIRLIYMYAFGGVYIDLDMCCRLPFSDLPLPHRDSHAVVVSSFSFSIMFAVFLSTYLSIGLSDRSAY